MQGFSVFIHTLSSLAQAKTPQIVIASGPPAAGLPELQNLFTRIIALSVPIAFMAVTVMLAVAGIKYLTSGGDSKALGAAHGTVTWALMGIVFLALSWLILLLIEAFTGVKVTQFNLTFPGT
jgi:hypothetical protein